MVRIFVQLIMAVLFSTVLAACGVSNTDPTVQPTVDDLADTDLATATPWAVPTLPSSDEVRIEPSHDELSAENWEILGFGSLRTMPSADDLSTLDEDETISIWREYFLNGQFISSEGGDRNTRLGEIFVATIRGSNIHHQLFHQSPIYSGTLQARLAGLSN